MWRLGLLLTLLATPALAQGPCVDRSDFLKHLAGTYDELPVAMGLTSRGAVLEVTVSEGGSWTIIITKPDGMTCGLAAGIGWETLKQKKDEGPGV